MMLFISVLAIPIALFAAPDAGVVSDAEALQAARDLYLPLLAARDDPNRTPTAIKTPGSAPNPTLTSTPIGGATATATRTVGTVPSATHTATATNTPIDPGVPTSTATNTPTATTTATATNTPTATTTATATATATSTPTITPLPPEEQVLVWDEVAKGPIVRHEAQGIVVDGKLYAMGGYTYDQASQYAPTRRVDVYDPATNTWKKLADMPNGLSHGGTTAIGRDIYIAGGYPLVGDGQGFSTDLVWRYNIDEDTWYANELPKLPKPNGGGDLEAVGRKLHYFGGADASRQDTAEHWVLDLDNIAAGWVAKAPILRAVNHIGGVVLNGELYAVGGQMFQDNAAKFLPGPFARYDPVKDAWVKRADMPKGRSHMNASVFAWQGKIWVLGGEPLSITRDVLVYDPVTNTWELIDNPLPVNRSSGIAGVIDDKIYMATGSTSDRAFVGEFVPASQAAQIQGTQTLIRDEPNNLAADPATADAIAFSFFCIIPE